MAKKLLNMLDTLLFVFPCFVICVVIWLFALPIELVIVFARLVFGRFGKSARTAAFNELRDYFFLVEDAWSNFFRAGSKAKGTETGRENDI